jgi:hypothetical protein
MSALLFGRGLRRCCLIWTVCSFKIPAVLVFGGIALPARFATCPPAALSVIFLRCAAFRRLPLYLRKTHRQHDLASEKAFTEKDISFEPRL